MNKFENPVLLAKIGAPHGIKGEVRVVSFTGNPMSLGDYGPLQDANGTYYKMRSIRPSKNVLVVKFKGINSRQEADALKGVELFIDRASLPDDTEDDEYYAQDLIGMDVLDEAETHIGTVMTVPNFGAGDLLEIAPLKEDGSISPNTWYLEFTRENVPEINFDKWFVKIITPGEVSERDDMPKDFGT